MSDGKDEFVTIRPRAVALSHRDEQKRPPLRISIAALVTGAVLILLIAVAVWVFLYLPQRVESTNTTASAAPAAQSPAAQTQPAAQPSAPTGPAPYEALQIDRERKRAQEMLAKFVKLQIELDDTMHVKAWASDAFDAAQQLANDGDALFTQQQFDKAMVQYEQGIAALETLRSQGQARFDAAIDAASQAIDRRDAAGAETAYTTAASVYPDDPRIAAGRSRAQRLPQIVELFDEADHAIEHNDWRTALQKYRAIHALDPAARGLQAALSGAEARVAELDFQGLLSSAYAALEANDYGAAKRGFDAALRQRPSDAAARDGMNQVEQRSTLSSIEQHHQSALSAEAAERWADAVADYDKVLGVDGSIKFAKDGRARAAARLELEKKLNAAIDDPGALSSDATYASTVQLYQAALKIAQPGARLTDQLNRVERMLAIASEPVPVTLTSDTATEVTISQLGPLGKFSRKELRLRPGRYVLIGSRDGRRDVRRQLDVTPQMGPVEIICQDAI